MASVTIYTTKLCGYCFAAKRLLKQKGVAYEEVDVSFSAEARQTMTARASGGRSVPQIFVDEHHVGGCDELYALENSGELDALLAG
ncbi:MAG: glutaredoxin 3 [Hyphomicrobiales bacterium]